MAEEEVRVMDDVSDDDSVHSDVTVVSNLKTNKKLPLKRQPMIDTFISMAEQVVADSGELLGLFPGSYGEEIEVQHLTVQDTMHVAERFLYKMPHTENDRITQIVKKLWHINNRYNYRQR